MAIDNSINTAAAANDDVTKKEEEVVGEMPQKEQDPSKPSSSDAVPAPRKRNTHPGVRVIGRRIYDSESGITCHQCRQKTRDAAARCKEMRKGKPCPIYFCSKCLLNRYGEKIDEVSAVENWSCPRCRGVCNCSLCMKKKGHKPTGILIHAAKATGFSSVHELLDHNGAHILGAETGLNVGCSSSKKDTTLSKRKLNKDDDHVGEDRNKMSRNEPQTEAPCMNVLSVAENSGADTAAMTSSKPVLPQGALLTEVAGIQWATEHVGPVLQFLEFCNAFSKVLDIKKGEPEYTLKELAEGHVARETRPAVMKFHKKLICFVEKEMEKECNECSTSNEDSCMISLLKCIDGSESALERLLLDNEPRLYHNWDLSVKLKVLNLLCDNTLDTEKLRKWIYEENTKFFEQKKEANATISAARKKKKDLKKKMKDHFANNMLSIKDGASFLDGEYQNHISELKAEVDKAHAEMLESMELLPKGEHRRDAVRTEPIFLEGQGHVYWELEGYFENVNVVLQDIGNWTSDSVEDTTTTTTTKPYPTRWGRLHGSYDASLIHVHEIRQGFTLAVGA